MTDHFGGSGGSDGGGGGLTGSDVNSLIAAASANNLTNTASSDPENTYSMVTFADAGGRGVKRARVSQDDLVENGRVIINSNTAQSIQFPETRGASGYALTMHRDPVLAALGRTEWYSEAVVVPDELEVSSLSSLNPGVTPLEIKTAVSFTGGQVVDFATSDCTNISILDAFDLKATSSLETPLVKNSVGNLNLSMPTQFITGGGLDVVSFGGGSLTDITDLDLSGTCTAGLVRASQVITPAVTSVTGLDLSASSGPVLISADALGQDVTVQAGGQINLTSPLVDCKGTVESFGGIFKGLVDAQVGLDVTGTTNLNGSVFCNNGLAVIRAPFLGASTSLALVNSQSSALGNLTANEDLVALVSKDLRRLKLVADDSDYVVIDPGTVDSPFTVTIGQPSTFNTIRGALSVEDGISTIGDLTCNNATCATLLCGDVKYTSVQGTAGQLLAMSSTPSLTEFIDPPPPGPTYLTASQNVTFHTTANSGTTATVTVTYERIGTVVTIRVPVFTVSIGNSSYNTILGNNAFPSNMTPVNGNSLFTCATTANSQQAIGYMVVHVASGSLRLIRVPGQQWNGGTSNAGLVNAIVFNYICQP